MDTLFFKIIIILSIMQSIIGVGLSITETSILLAYNFYFFEALQIILPLSLIANLYQLINKTKKNNIFF
jgi:hypothetical protein